MADYVALSVVEFHDGTTAIAKIAEGSEPYCAILAEFFPPTPVLNGKAVRDHWCVILPRSEYVGSWLDGNEAAVLASGVGHVGQA